MDIEIENKSINLEIKNEIIKSKKEGLLSLPQNIVKLNQKKKGCFLYHKILLIKLWIFIIYHILNQGILRIKN